MQVLQDPDSLADVEIPAEGADFEAYEYVAINAYAQKKEIETNGLASILKDYRAWIGREGQTSEEAYLRTLEYKNDIYQDIDVHQLGAEEKEEILSEVDLRADISSCWNREMLPGTVPRLCWRYGIGQAIVQFFFQFGWALYGGLVVAMFECGIGYQSGRGSVRDTALNAVKGFMAVGLFSVVPVRLYQLCVSQQGTLNRIQVQMATAREFLILIRLRNEKGAEVFSYLDRIEKSLKEQEFSVSRAGSEDIKRILAVYYKQNVTSEKFEDFDGEWWIIPDD